MPVTSLEMKCKVQVKECKATKNRKKVTFTLTLFHFINVLIPWYCLNIQYLSSIISLYTANC